MRPWAALLVPAELDAPTVDLMTELLTQLNERFLWRAPAGTVPLLYASGARYEPQPEFWLTIPWALAAARTGRGLDCKVLGAWRAAELRVLGEPARCFAEPYEKDGKTMFHVRVMRAWGRQEDPSEILGMYEVLAKGQEARPWNLLASPY